MLDELWPMRGDLRDEQMKKLLDHTIQENRSQLGPQSRQQWDQWLKTEFPRTP